MNPDPDDVTFQFNQIQLTLKAADDDDVSFGLNRIDAGGEPESVELSPENDDLDHDGENEPELKQLAPETSPENDDVTFNVSQVQIDSKASGNDDVDDEEADVEGGGDDVEDEDDDVTFNVSPVRIDSKPQKFTSESSPENDDVTFGSSQAQINADDDVADEGADVEEEEEEDDDVEGEEFTFMCINPDDNSLTELTEKTVFPLFDQSLLYNSLNQDGKRINDIHVDNVFIESPRDATSSSSSSASTTLTAITDSNEMNIKSNSTGFSKLWRFRDHNNMNRSNSDGRDAFVFLNPKTEGKGKGKEVREVVKKKVKKANVSAHEVYLKKAKGGGEEEKRKSYLPYRPGLMGFFTNVNGGLSKNVHPF